MRDAIDISSSYALYPGVEFYGVDKTFAPNCIIKHGLLSKDHIKYVNA